ncbi:MAG: VOC family protein [Dehalococcoidia bacterium]|nr:VOC family protein [Dehalococcoidia bacterium]
MGNPVVHFDISVNDEAKAHAFYSEMFGWKLNHMPEMGYALVDPDAEGRGIMGGIGKAQDGQLAVNIYVEVDDVKTALDKAISLGGRLVQDVQEIPGMVILGMFADPEGNVIGLVGSQTPPAE